MIKIICTEEEKEALITVIAGNNYECLFDELDNNVECKSCRSCLDAYIEWEVTE